MYNASVYNPQVKTDLVLQYITIQVPGGTRMPLLGHFVILLKNKFSKLELEYKY